jgi:hypothetical protein
VNPRGSHRRLGVLVNVERLGVLVNVERLGVLVNVERLGVLVNVERKVARSLTLAEEQQRFAAQRSQALLLGSGARPFSVASSAIASATLVWRFRRMAFDEPEFAFELVERVPGQLYAAEAPGAEPFSKRHVRLADSASGAPSATGTPPRSESSST